MRFTETVLMSWAEKNWKSMPLMAEATGRVGFMAVEWRALHPHPVLCEGYRRKMRTTAA
jgi:hypothetical protein